ncbi:MAG: hypothetical protein GY757_51570, partial [bacterium]|nr:hypothetical protein [bacterium]
EYQFEKLYLRQRSSLESGWRIRRWETSHRVSLDYGRRNRFYFNLYVQKRELTYGDELLLDTFNMNRMFNRTEYLLGISANKNIFSRSTLAFQFEYFDDRFLYTKLRNRTGGQVSMRLTIPAGSHLTGQMRIGLRFTRPQSSLYRDFTKPFGSGTLTLSLMGRFRLQVNYRLDSTYSFAAADLYYDVRTIGSGLSFFITREISISYNYTTGYRTYKLIGVNDESRRDQFSTSRIRLRIRRGEKTELGFEYGINRTDSTSLRFNRSQDYIGGYFRYDL